MPEATLTSPSTTPTATHTIEATVSWRHRPSPLPDGCRCCPALPGLPAGHHVYLYDLVLPRRSDRGPRSVAAWLNRITWNKRAVPNGSRLRVTVEILPPEEPTDA